MTENSIKAYNQTAKLQQSNKEKVLQALRKEGNHSRFWVGRETGLGHLESQRRLSDLVNEDKVVITGSRKHFNQDISLYSIKDQGTLFPVEKQLSLRQWLKKEFPEILYKYEILVEKKI